MPLHGIIVPIGPAFETFLQHRTVLQELPYTDDELMSNLVAALTNDDASQRDELEHFIMHYGKHHEITEVDLVRDIYGDFFNHADLIFQQLYEDEEISQNRENLTYHAMTPGGDLVLALVRE